VPAAAGTPAPIAYVNAAAVKELVAGYRPRRGGSPEGDTSPFRAQWRGHVGWVSGPSAASSRSRGRVSVGVFFPCPIRAATAPVSLRKLECSEQAAQARTGVHGTSPSVPDRLSVGFRVRVQGQWGRPGALVLRR